MSAYEPASAIAAPVDLAVALVDVAVDVVVLGPNDMPLGSVKVGPVKVNEDKVIEGGGGMVKVGGVVPLGSAEILTEG